MAAICRRVRAAIPRLSLRFHSPVDPQSWPEFLGDSWSKRGTYGSLGRDLGIKGEAGHCEHPTDTKANKSLQLPAGGQPVPRGGCWIKRSPERLIGQGGLRKSEYNDTRCVTLYEPWCILFFSWKHFLLLLFGTLFLTIHTLSAFLTPTEQHEILLMDARCNAFWLEGKPEVWWITFNSITCIYIRRGGDRDFENDASLSLVFFFFFCFFSSVLHIIFHSFLFCATDFLFEFVLRLPIS